MIHQESGVWFNLVKIHSPTYKRPIKHVLIIVNITFSRILPNFDRFEKRDHYEIVLNGSSVSFRTRWTHKVVLPTQRFNF